jgi:hypothetical protein
MTSIDRFRKAKPVTHKSRRTRASILPGIDNLDERVLMAGNVMTSLDTMTGTLYIKGDAGNNSVQVSMPDPTKIRVQGTLGTATAINGVAYKDWTISNFTKMVVQMDLGGKDSVTLTKIKVATSITMTSAGTGDDKFTLDTVTTNTLSISSNVGLLPKTDISLVNDTIGSAVTVKTGDGNDTITVRGGKLGAVSIDTGNNLAVAVGTNVPLDTVLFSPISAKAVSITSGTGDHDIEVYNTTVNSLVICTGDSDPGYVCDCLTIHTSKIMVDNTTITKNVTGLAFTCLPPGTPGETALVNPGCPPAALYICAGDNTDILIGTNGEFGVNAPNGDMDISVGDNTWAPEFEHVSQFIVANSFAKAMHFIVGDGDYNISIINNQAIGGSGFTLDTQGTLGTGDKNILLALLTVDGITDPFYGDSVFVVIVSGDPSSNNTVSIDTVNVDVTSPVFSLIWGNFGPLNTFVDYGTGPSSGFDFDGFSGYLFY